MVEFFHVSQGMVKVCYKPPSESYFCGQVYSSYDEETTNFPKDLFDLLKEFCPLKGRLLDIGCATGVFLEYAQKQGLEFEGVDLSDWAVQIANTRTSGKCRVLDVDSARISDFKQPFDIITLHSVIEHLEFPEKALDLMYNITVPGGIVYIQTLTSDSLMHTILKDDWGGFTDYTHKSHWITKDWIVKTAEDLGFKVVFTGDTIFGTITNMMMSGLLFVI